jgi:hypothetical protein
MIIKTAVQPDGTQCRAIYSDCETYRYDLIWRWSDAPLLVAWMLNPSTATELQLDNTVKGIRNRAKAQGFGGFRIINLFALRETSPRKMKSHIAPIGPDNDAMIGRVLAEAAECGDTIVCGWGTHGSHRGRSASVAKLIQPHGVELFAYKINKNGSPRHPLYVAHASPLISFHP